MTEKSRGKVSIVIPVYKTEKYLSRCIESVLRQTYQDFEIILVDDGSPDRSGEICDQYAKTDRRIKVYHRPNSGVAATRNYGTAHASGKYIAHIDSDDYFAETYIEYLLNLIEENDADISVCAMVETDNDEADFLKTYGIQDTMVLTGKEACFWINKEPSVSFITPWGKLYKKETIDKYPYPIGHRCEDESTTPKYYYEAKYVAIGNKCLYAYFCNPTSQTHSAREKKNMDAIWSLANCALFFEDKNEKELARDFWARYFSFCLRDGREHNERCYDDIKARFKLKRLNGKMLVHIPLYLASPKLYRAIKSVGIALIRMRHSQRTVNN